ncbi:MAG: glycosyl hydrolase [Ideonella sp.]|nr:glycosyl hydrolase [Ideonella sp.]
MRLMATLTIAVALLGGQGQARSADFFFAPYKDASLMLDADSGLMQRLKGQAPAPLLAPELPALIWAFATGECGQETWGTVDTDRFAQANVAAFVQAQRPYVVSTGGEAGSFTCGSDEGFAKFLARYDSPFLRGLDFDIERQQTAVQIDDLVQRAAALQRQCPALRVSFTVATHAAANGSQQSLNALGETVLRSLRRHNFERAILNLMVMNYGPALPAHCVMRDGRCDMGASALQAARNVSAKYGVPMNRIALTPMLGENDVAHNVFTLAEAQELASAARTAGLAGLHYWSLDRDQSCPAGEPRVSPRCHALPALQPDAFFKALQRSP